MLYTSYVAKLSVVPVEAIKLVIMRVLPEWLKTPQNLEGGKYVISKYPNTYWSMSLSPSMDLMLWYKRNKNWVRFSELFASEMNTRRDMIDGLQKLDNLLSAGKDVYIFCIEKNYCVCHRSLIAKNMENRGHIWREF